MTVSSRCYSVISSYCRLLENGAINTAEFSTALPRSVGKDVSINHSLSRVGPGQNYCSNSNFNLTFVAAIAENSKIL